MSKAISRWFENTLLVAVAGSIIALIGTFASTIMPITYGPEDISDFSIKVESKSLKFDVQNITNDRNNSAWVDIRVDDFHKWLRPYRFMIHFQALGSSINNTYALFDPTDMILPSPFDFGKYRSPLNQSGKHILMPLDMVRVHITTKSTDEGTFPVLIQGVGSNGKIRNATLYIKILSHEDYQLANKGQLPILGDKIHN